MVSFEQMNLIIEQLKHCESTEGSALQISTTEVSAFVSCEGVWDCFLFSHPEADIVDQVEKAKGLWYSTEELEFLDSVNLFHVLRCNSKNRIHFSGFIADLLLKLEKKSFPEALEITLLEWRKRWSLQSKGMSFEDRIGLFGELIVFRDLLVSGKVNSANEWTARKKGDGLHDFVFPNRKFEVKTSMKDVGEIHIFHEDQMHHSDGLYMLYLKIEFSDLGLSIDQVCNEISQNLSSEKNADFLTKLSRSGFIFGKYEEEMFKVRNKYYWKSHIESPFIQIQDIRQEIVRPLDISYYILESSVDFTSVENFASLCD
jgi:hypothetical protein